MIAAMIVPTGIGAEIGGHSGDATAAATLLAAACDKLILHPNVVNASDLSEQPPNSLYVEGAMLDSFLEGEIRLREVRRNRILVVCNEAGKKTVNSVNAYRSILGIDAAILELKIPLIMRGRIEGDHAGGEIENMTEMVEQIREHGKRHPIDALAVHTPVDVEKEVSDAYLADGGINPWGGVEALLSHALYRLTGIPNAHAPLEAADVEYGISDPRLAPEMICAAHLGSVLKGLHRAPGRSITGGIGAIDVDALVSPLCWGAPHEACRRNGIPIIFVTENPTTQVNRYVDRPDGDQDISAATYLEAAGLLLAIRLGLSMGSVRRPLESVTVIR